MARITRHREVVQRREGFRLHHPGERRKGLLRPPHRHQGGRVPQPRRGRAGRVRHRAGREGPRRRERDQGQVSSVVQTRRAASGRPVSSGSASLVGATAAADARLFVPVDDPAAGQIVGREHHADPVALQHADLELAHLARRRRPGSRGRSRAGPDSSGRAGPRSRRPPSRCLLLSPSGLPPACRRPVAHGPRALIAG